MSGIDLTELAFRVKRRLDEVFPDDTEPADALREQREGLRFALARLQAIAGELQWRIPLGALEAYAAELRKAERGLFLAGLAGIGLIALAARYKLPAVAPFRYFVSEGGLISYGADLVEQYRRAAGYVDRILKGEKPSEMPVQVPTKYEMAINLKTAKALDLTVPPSVLARADNVIE